MKKDQERSLCFKLLKALTSLADHLKSVLLFGSLKKTRNMNTFLGALVLGIVGISRSYLHGLGHICMVLTSH